MRKRSYVTSFSVPADKLKVLEELDKIARRELVSTSKIILDAITEYIERHQHGNPQKPLFPHIEPWRNPPVEKRHENLEWLISLIKNNDGIDEGRLAAKFSAETGLRLETVREYVQTLLMSGTIYRRGGKLYVKGS